MRNRPSPPFARFALGIVAASTLGFASPALAQMAPPAQAAGYRSFETGGVELRLTTGRTHYDRDDQCGLYSFWLTSFELGLSRGWLGVSTSVMMDYPWPLPPPDTMTVIDRGASAQIMVEAFPLHVVGLGTIGDYVQPFVGGGIMYSSAGTMREAGDTDYGEVLGILRRIDLGFTYGANVVLGRAGSPVGFVVQARRTTLPSVRAEAEGIDGRVIEAEEGINLSWNEVRVGVTLRPGRR